MHRAVFYWFLVVVVWSMCLVNSIEVHESPNEESTTTDSGMMLKSMLPNSHSSVGSGANNNEPGKQQQVTVASGGTPASIKEGGGGGAGNSGDYSIVVPSNHRPATATNSANSPSYRDAPLSITTPTMVSSSASSSSSRPSSSSAVATQPSSVSSSSSSGLSSKNSGGPKDVVGGSNLVQHQISGYKKRQLYAGSYQQLTKNATNDRSYDKDNQPASKEFIPSPELVPYYPPEDHHHHHHHPSPHHHPHQYQQQAIHQVDAPYPGHSVTSADSKWFGGNHFAPATSGPGPNKWEQSSKSGKLLWLPNANGGAELESPFSRPPSAAKPKLNPAPKGKWKWVPVEDGEGEGGAAEIAAEGLGDDSLQQGERAPADLESKIVAGGGHGHHHHGVGHHHHYYKFPSRDHPYSFDGGEGQSPFSGGGGGSTSDEGSSAAAGGGSTASNPLDFFYGTGVIGDATGSTKLKTGSGSGESSSLKKGTVSPWKKIIHVLTAAIPIGLIISALTPQVVYVNPNMTLPPVQMQTPTPISATGGSFTNPTRQRLLATTPEEEDGENPLVGFINSLSVAAGTGTLVPSSAIGTGTGSSSSATGCEERSFCEMARIGRNEGADALLRMLWKTANETPPDRARQSGLEEIFRAVRDDDCSRFHCEAT